MEALADAARRRLAAKVQRGMAGGSGDGSSSGTSNGPAAPSGPPVVWEKPFGNRVRSSAGRCFVAAASELVLLQHRLPLLPVSFLLLLPIFAAT